MKAKRTETIDRENYLRVLLVLSNCLGHYLTFSPHRVLLDQLQLKKNTQNPSITRLWSHYSFNAAPGTGAAMRSAAARLSIMSCEERAEMKKEIRECLGPIGLNLKTLHKMKKLDNLVCEVCLCSKCSLCQKFFLPFWILSSSCLSQLDKMEKVKSSDVSYIALY